MGVGGCILHWSSLRLMLLCFSGSVCVFTGLLSVAFLGRTILGYMWIGIGTLTVGLVLIGVADAAFLGFDEDVNSIISGKLY